MAKIFYIKILRPCLEIKNHENHVWQLENYFLFYIIKYRKYGAYKKHLLVVFLLFLLVFLRIVLKNNYN